MSTDGLTGFRLSPVQQRLRALMHAGPDVLRVEALMASDGRLDAHVLHEAWIALAREHEILRTSFVDVDGGETLQCVHEVSRVAVTCLDLLGADDETVWTRVRAQCARPEEAADTPSSCALTIVTAETCDYLYMSLSPLIADRRSVQAIAAAMLSRERREGTTRPGDALQFADVAEWAHALRESEHAEDGRLFWQSQSIAPAMFRALPCGRGTRRSDRFDFARIRGAGVQLPASTIGRADVLPSPEAAALGCWAWLSAQHLEQGEVIIGVSCDGREEPEMARVIGPMTATLPVHVRIDRSETFARLCARLEQTLTSTRAWQEVFPWERLDDPSDRSDQSAEQFAPASLPIAFEYAESHVSDLADVPDVRASSWRMCERRADTDRYAVKLVCVRRGDRLIAEMHIDRAAIAEDEAARLLAQLERLLAHVLQQPSAPIGALASVADAPSLSPSPSPSPAAPALAASCRDTPRESDPALALAHALIEQQAAATPDAIALVEGDDCVTYAELNRRANRLARFLRARGLEPEARVGICLQRSTWMFTAVLAVLKAGGAFVPLDGSPRKRLRAIVEASGIRTIVADASTLERLADVGADAIDVIELPARWTEMTSLPAGNLRANLSGANLAYVLFTSGSTGAPKGVMVTHESVARYIEWARTAYDRPETAGTILHSPLEFDFTITALLLPLASGRAVWLASEPSVDFLARHVTAGGELTFLKLTPAHVRALGCLGPMHPAATGMLVIGGEALTVEDLRWLAGSPNLVIVNEYGPTEATVGCCVYTAAVEHLLREETGAVPIGRPIADTRLNVLRPDGSRPPAGVPGELTIGGACLARGYLAQPDLTAMSFRPDPDTPRAGDRTYLTGDRVRERPDGDLVYLGRADSQVKLHGFRIELDEVAHVARQLPGVTGSVALVTDDDRHHAGLALVLQAPRGTRFTDEDVRARLADRLPAYMIPSRIVTVDALPLTDHGKVDRHALRRLLAAPVATASTANPPATPAERDFAEIWKDVLALDAVGIDDNFFALGGDSIRSIQVLGLTKRRGYHLSLAQLLAAPTIRQLAAIGGQARADAIPDDVRLPFALLRDEDRASLPADIDDAYPMIAMQEGMLFHSEWEAHTAAYHDIVGVHIEGPYDRRILEDTLRDVIAAHPVLRTVFDLRRFSEPIQLVRREVSLTLEEHDLSQLTAELQEAAVRGWLAAEKRRRFDWSESPPHRIFVHRRGPDSFQFTLSFHHALLDGWSTASLLIEIFGRYAAACGLLEERPPAPPRSLFRDYVYLERATRASDESRTFWRRYLEDAPSTCYGGTVAADAATPGPQDGVRRLEREIPVETYARLSALASEWGVPLKTVLLAAHVKVVCTLVNRCEIVTGVVSSGRVNEIDGARALGLFLNTLPLRTTIANRSWLALVRALYDNDARWTPHRRFPLAEIVRIPVAADLFDTAFNFVHYHNYRTLPPLPGVRVLQVHAFEQTSLPLLASFVQSGASDRLTLLLDIDEARIPAGRLPALADLYINALHAIARGPDAPVLDCDILPAPQDAQLRTWAAAPMGDTLPMRVDRRVLAQAAATPDAVAIVDGSHHVSYRQLVSRTRRVVRALARRNIGTDDVVALDLDRGLSLMVSCLGTMLAGAAYVYVDRSLPAERRAFIVRDSRARLLFSDGAAIDELAECECVRVAADDLLAESSDPPGASRCDAPGADDDLDALCYLVYTSGSTGTPKGIAMPHGPIAALVAWQIEASGGRARRTLQYTTLAFDVALQEMYATWGAGGTLVLAHSAMLDDPRQLWDLLQSEEIERLFLPGAALRQLLAARAQATTPGPLASIDHVLIGGSVLQLTADLRAFFAEHPGVAMTNQYGPGETHVITWFTPAGPSETWPVLPSIGRPIAAADVHVLDDRLRPVPIGSVGEIYVGGGTVARGYMNRPDLTASRFIPDPRGGRSGARLYRSGDLARWDDDGKLEFLGRTDHQIKIRGHRVELEEIEAVMTRASGVTEAVVAARTAADGEIELVGYLVLAAPDAAADADNADDAIARVREQLARTLPRHMWPARLIALDAMPRTVSGKIDRQRLPRVDGVATTRRRPTVLPDTALEAIILSVWKHAMRDEELGVEDDFLEAGGHSLTATRIVVGLRAALQMDLPIRAVFDLCTVRAMARELASRTIDVPIAAGATTPGLVDRVDRDSRLSLAPQQENWWYNEYLIGQINPHNIHFGRRVTGPLQRSALAQALASLQRRHEALRTAFIVDDTGMGRPTIAAADDASLPLVFIDLSGLPPDTQAVVLRDVSRLERQRPFNLARGTLYRVALVRLGPDEHVMMFTVHHLVCDDWSMMILTRELSVLYAAAAAGVPASLPALPFQYVDFAQWQREWLASPAAATELDYWRRQLAPPLGDMFASSSSSSSGEAEGAGIYLSVRGRIPFEIPAAAAEAARRVAGEERCTLFATVLAAFELVLFAFTGARDIRIGTATSNRAVGGTEAIVGLFTNLLCLRTRVDPARSFRELVRTVRTTTAEAIQHQILPFELLAGWLRAEQGQSSPRLFQAIVLWQAIPPEALRMPGVESRVYWPEEETSEPVLSRNALDLKLELMETSAALHGRLTYNPSRFAAAQIRDMADALTRCLLHAARNPAMTVAASSQTALNAPGTGGMPRV